MESQGRCGRAREMRLFTRAQIEKRCAHADGALELLKQHHDETEVRNAAKGLGPEHMQPDLYPFQFDFKRAA